MNKCEGCNTIKTETLFCPRCFTILEYCKGNEYIPEYFYCPKCHDIAYNADGEVIGGIK